MKAAEKQRKERNTKTVWISNATIGGQVRTATYNKQQIAHEFKRYAEKIRLKKNMEAGNVGQSDGQSN